MHKTAKKNVVELPPFNILVLPSTPTQLMFVTPPEAISVTNGSQKQNRTLPNLEVYFADKLVGTGPPPASIAPPAAQLVQQS